jgi:hypothetical protein
MEKYLYKNFSKTIVFVASRPLIWAPGSLSLVGSTVLGLSDARKRSGTALSRMNSWKIAFQVGLFNDASLRLIEINGVIAINDVISARLSSQFFFWLWCWLCMQCTMHEWWLSVTWMHYWWLVTWLDLTWIKLILKKSPLSIVTRQPTDFSSAG